MSRSDCYLDAYDHVMVPCLRMLTGKQILIVVMAYGRFYVIPVRLRLLLAPCYRMISYVHDIALSMCVLDFCFCVLTAI